MSLSIKIVIYTAALQDSQPNRLYTRLPGVNIKLLFTRPPFQSEFRSIHGCRVSTLNRYLHGSHSRVKSTTYIAAGCIKIFIYTAAVQEQNRLYTLLPDVFIKLLFARQPIKSQIGYIHYCRRVTVHLRLYFVYINNHRNLDILY